MDQPKGLAPSVSDLIKDIKVSKVDLHAFVWLCGESAMLVDTNWNGQRYMGTLMVYREDAQWSGGSVSEFLRAKEKAWAAFREDSPNKVHNTRFRTKLNSASSDSVPTSQNLSASTHDVSESLQQNYQSSTFDWNLSEATSRGSPNAYLKRKRPASKPNSPAVRGRCLNASPAYATEKTQEILPPVALENTESATGMSSFTTTESSEMMNGNVLSLGGQESSNATPSGSTPRSAATSGKPKRKRKANRSYEFASVSSRYRSRRYKRNKSVKQKPATEKSTAVERPMADMNTVEIQKQVSNMELAANLQLTPSGLRQFVQQTPAGSSTRHSDSAAVEGSDKLISDSQSTVVKATQPKQEATSTGTAAVTRESQDGGVKQKCRDLAGRQNPHTNPTIVEMQPRLGNADEFPCKRKPQKTALTHEPFHTASKEKSTNAGEADSRKAEGPSESAASNPSFSQTSRRQDTGHMCPTCRIFISQDEPFYLHMSTCFGPRKKSPRRRSTDHNPYVKLFDETNQVVTAMLNAEQLGNLNHSKKSLPRETTPSLTAGTKRKVGTPVTHSENPVLALSEEDRVHTVKRKVGRPRKNPDDPSPHSTAGQSRTTATHSSVVSREDLSSTFTNSKNGGET